MKKAGFIDIQSNGYKGIDFSSETLTLDQIRTATRELVKDGTIAYCATLITQPIDGFRRNLALMAEAMRDPECSRHILGIHIEGPFISPEEGARGAHPTACIIPPSVDVFRQMQEWADNKVILLTLAPEVEGATALIRYASEHGTVVALGHHLADDAALEQAVQAGARACTHLGNGMPNMINRHQNPLWWQLACDNLTGTFITDGHHLPADFIKVACRAKTTNHFIVVSDQSSLAGLPPGTYEFHGSKVVLAPTGRISLGDTPYLAGSSATMLQCMNHLASLEILSEAELWQVGYENPLALLGIKRRRFHAVNGQAFEFRGNRFEITSA
ncbi:MAG: N-acetylglucosamine-6-phosphate deacetylase [Verrucomicrobia bacterium]|nr:N-acetylglucosamine-6-phosphate deacetylase [Verrucomicrobiota bacterium]MCG2680143.1 N-acetylglucosamine-6-phosphate deacetylase [Kiritimatiellia bacterium]MBU4247052.1 N-acetylglucosamine-6-phosphate deacetylase [Verrucomicrobiota bacterium]MBU4291126.1 N-acetylglucosamine-6-phosphate deacetylase [Verrucomicrobiota bacterium]MBU4429298.1 N-acetylglucosamine-6-phosphate deacetylase [Verrucomicrobiota bacterium]